MPSVAIRVHKIQSLKPVVIIFILRKMVAILKFYRLQSYCA